MLQCMPKPKYDHYASCQKSLANRALASLYLGLWSEGARLSHCCTTHATGAELLTDLTVCQAFPPLPNEPLPGAYRSSHTSATRLP